MMNFSLPSHLKESIIELSDSWTLKDLAQHSSELSQRYREGKGKSGAFIESQGQRMAYLLTRFPATFGAISRVLFEIREQMPTLEIKSLLDLGAGPGTGFWAAIEQFPHLQKATLIEKDLSFMQLGQKLEQKLMKDFSCSVDWQRADVKDVALPPHDLFLLSYSIGEFSENLWPALLQNIWQATEKAVIIIEPGTPLGFKRLLSIRKQMIELGAYLVAPCPHAAACPMKGDDWCHFSVRVERSFQHRYVKGASLSYEDEKFSYLIFSKKPHVAKGLRILRPPLKHSGHLSLSLCTSLGEETKILSRKHKEEYMRARKLEWGDTF